MDVGDSLLLGSSEGGFCGLEALTPEDHFIIDDSITDAAAEPSQLGKRKGNTKIASGEALSPTPQI